MVIENELKKNGFNPKTIQLGQVDFEEQSLNKDQIELIEKVITPLGFEILSDKTSRLVNTAKSLILDYLNLLSGNQKKESLSTYLKNELGYDYNYISNIYSSISGETIEQYYIKLKIEKIKELLIYDDQTINEISYQLDYSSPAHLSNQFKKITGLTPTQFKKLRNPNIRKPIDNL